MKKLMQILLATFGIMVLAFTGCTGTDVEVDDEVADDSTVTEDTAGAEDAAVMEDAE